MDGKIIKIGHSKGLIIPAEILKEMKLQERSVVNISVGDHSIVIKPAPRQGWEHAAIECHKHGDDELLMPDVFEEEEVLPW